MTHDTAAVMAVSLALAYLVGSIPFGYLVYRLGAGGDIRRTGSGNIGATNVYRTAGKAAGLLTLVMDAVKGAAAVWIAGRLTGSHDAAILAAPAALVGHMFPVFLRFKGGKGVAPGLGAFAVLAPVPLLCAAAVFLGTMAASRIVSLASIASASALPAAVGLLGGSRLLVAVSIACSILIIVRHHANIARLAAGTEKPLWGAPKRG